MYIETESILERGIWGPTSEPTPTSRIGSSMKALPVVPCEVLPSSALARDRHLASGTREDGTSSPAVRGASHGRVIRQDS